MLILKYVTFGTTKDDHLYNIIVPTHIKKESITAVSPLFTSSGSFFKNITVLEDNVGKEYRVVGNYKDYANIIENNKQIGYTK